MPVFLLEDDKGLLFNFHKKSVHFDAIQKEDVWMVVGDVYADKIGKFTFHMTAHSVHQDLDLADYAWRDEVEKMFKLD